MTETDEFMKLLKEHFWYEMTNVHTSFPGVVQSYDPKTRRADIQPSLKRLMPNGEYLALPVLCNVPVRFPGSKKYTIHFTLEEGDEVDVSVSERSTDKWRSSGGKDIEDGDTRRFSLADCYCSPGLQPTEFIAVEEVGLSIVHKTAHDGDFVSRLTMDDDKVQVKYKEKAEVLIEDDHIQAKTEKCKLDMTGANLAMENGKDKITANDGNVDVEAGTKATIKASTVEITGGSFKVGGSVSPTGQGALCAIPACLFTGAPHVGDTASGT